MNQQNRTRAATLHAISLVLATPLATQAATLDIVDGTYRAFASVQAAGVTDAQDFAGSATSTTFSIGAHASAAFDDPDLGLHSASASGAVSWSLADAGNVSTLTTGVGGIAEGVSNGLDTFATGYGTLSLVFDVHERIRATVDSEGTYLSDLYTLAGTEWVPFYIGLNGLDTVPMDPGRYRWSGSAGYSISGYDYYSAGIFFTLEAAAVPEAGTVWLTGLGLLGLGALTRRRAAPVCSR